MSYVTDLKVAANTVFFESLRLFVKTEIICKGTGRLIKISSRFYCIGKQRRRIPGLQWWVK